MTKYIVVTFPNESKAYEGRRALTDLHAEGSITVYGSAVIAKEMDGRISIKETVDSGPLGMSVGALVGGLVGVLGGPVGVAVGLGTGSILGGITVGKAPTATTADVVVEPTPLASPQRPKDWYPENHSYLRPYHYKWRYWTPG